jgi:hypothetical protein
MFVCLTACASIPACTPGIDTEALADNLPAILDRHDAYAPALVADDAEREGVLAESKYVRDTFDANRNGHMPANFGPHVYPVMERHDAWVQADTTLSELQRTVYLNSSKAVLLLFQAAEDIAPDGGADGG